MDEQLAQMGHVAEALDDVEYNAKRARNTAKVMARNAATDRCIQVCFEAGFCKRRLLGRNLF